jgi:hypothetical protein
MIKLEGDRERERERGGELEMDRETDFVWRFLPNKLREKN